MVCILHFCYSILLHLYMLLHLYNILLHTTTFIQQHLYNIYTTFIQQHTTTLAFVATYIAIHDIYSSPHPSHFSYFSSSIINSFLKLIVRTCLFLSPKLTTAPWKPCHNTSDMSLMRIWILKTP